MKKDKDGIADQMDGKLLLIEQIAELELTEFLVGVDPNIGDRGRVNNFKIILLLGRFPIENKTEIRYLITCGYHNFMR